MFEKYYDKKFMDVLKHSLINDFKSWAKTSSLYTDCVYYSGDVGFMWNDGAIRTDKILLKNTNNKFVDIVSACASAPNLRVKVYEFKFLERRALRKFLKIHFKEKEKEVIRKMESVKDDIVTGLTIDTL